MPTYVIVGGGPAATNAMETIRQFDTNSNIVLISDEPAHSRMALPYWLAGKITREHTYTGDAAYFEKLRVETHLGKRVTELHTQAKQLRLDDGSQLAFDKLLLATGARPLRPNIPGCDLPGVLPMWTLGQAEQALTVLSASARPRVVLVGAGFIGFIVLNALYKRGCQLAVVERERQVLPRMLDSLGARYVQRWLTEKQIGVYTGQTVVEIRSTTDGTKQVRLSGGDVLAADLVVLAVGIQPNVELAQGAGLEVDQGILVNRYLQTSDPHIYAAGDVAQGPVLLSTERQIHAIQPTAVEHGRVAGANMAGHTVEYPGSLSMNVVDVCGLQTISMGLWDGGAEHVLVVNNPADRIYRKLVWRQDQIVGAIFIGRANDVGMLTDVGMVKGLIQTQAHLGAWKRYLEQNPFDIRRAYVGAGVPQQLLRTTLLGTATRPRGYVAEPQPRVEVGPAHTAYVTTRPTASS